MDVGLSKKPWEHHSYEYKHTYYTTFHGVSSDGPFECDAIYSTVKDSRRLGYRKCDLVRYYRKYTYGLFGDWRDWFPEKPKKKRIEIDTKVSKYLTGQYGIVIQRYKRTKKKGTIYNDYGTSVLTLTGKHKGIIRNWYRTSYPFHIINAFPYVFPFPKILIKNLTKMLGNDPTLLCKNIQDSEEQRDLFLEKIWNYFTGELNEKTRHNKTI